MVEVNRYQRLVVVRENALERTFARFLHNLVDFVDAGLALRDKSQVDSGYVDRRHTHRETVEFAIEVREYEANSGRSAGACRDLRHGGGTRTP
jgi:hypothetical protein